MLNELKIFESKKFGKIRTLKIENEPYFVAIDVCNALDLKNPTMVISRLDEDERTKFNLGRQGETNLVNEYGLYNLILASRKKEAKEFKRWITHEVLPNIRKHGMYATDELLNNPDLLIQVATQLKEEREKRKALERQHNINKPKVLFANAVESSKTSVLIGDLAKIMRQNGVEIGQNKLFRWLRDNKYLISRKGESYNLPTQKAMEQGLFEIKERTRNNYGTILITKTPKVTGKGQVFFINKFLSGMAEI